MFTTPSYNHVRETLFNGRDKISFEDIKDVLLQRELIKEQLVEKD